MPIPVFAAPYSHRPSASLTRAALVRRGLCCAALVIVGTILPAQPVRAPSEEKAAVPGSTPTDIREAMHREESWLTVAPHLPDPATASPDKLEMAADVLRARRFPEDALDFYAAAIRQGGNQERLMNKLGVTELGLRRTQMAHSYFQLVLKRDGKNADAWNNLGATEYTDGNSRRAISAYRKAVKLSPGTAIFHLNLGTAYVEQKRFEEAGKEFATALDLDPEIGAGHDSAAGISAHVLSAADHARYCFEMARVYATRGRSDAMLYWLEKASESGMDLHAAMTADATTARYLKDAQVVMLLQNAALQRKSNVAGLSAAALQPLPPAPAEAARP